MIESGEFTAHCCGSEFWLESPAPKVADFTCPECGERYPAEIQEDSREIRQLEFESIEELQETFPSLSDGVGWDPESDPVDAWDLALYLIQNFVAEGDTK